MTEIKIQGMSIIHTLVKYLDYNKPMKKHKETL